MTASAVSICSNASLLLGGNPFNDFGEDSDRARLGGNLFEPLRDYVLRRHPWNCAIAYKALAPDTASPATPDWVYQFTLPADFLRVLSVGPVDDPDEYEVAGQKLLCDANPAYLRYVFRNDNPATWDAQLIWAMTVTMKAAFTYPITQSTSLEQLVEAALKDILKQARAVDGQEGTPDAITDSPLLQARFGMGRRNNIWG